MRQIFLRIANFIRFTKFNVKKNITIKGGQGISLTTQIEISNNVNYAMIGRISTNKNCRIAVRDKAILKINDECTFNVGCQIICRDEIIIGKNTHFGCNVTIIDNDHCFNIQEGYTKGFNTERIIIGENCLIGAGTIILKGVQIGNNCLIAAGSVITHDIPDKSVIIQKRVDR